MATPVEQVDPRVVRTREVVLAAVLEELADVGHARFTIESVAARCGVGKSTIYRHWDGKTQLISDALRTLNPQPADVGAPSYRARVDQLLRHLVSAVTDGPLASAIPALVEAAERDTGIRRLFHAYSAGRRMALREAIASGIDAGEFPAHVDAELAAHALSGAIFYARLFTSTPLSADDVGALIDSTLT